MLFNHRFSTLVFVSFMLLSSCRQNAYNKDVPNNSVSGFQFESTEAERLNSDAVKAAQSGKSDLADELFSRALQFEPDNPTVLCNIGITYDLKGEDTKAVEYYRKAIEVSDTTYILASVNLGNLYGEMGDYLNGLHYLDYAVKHCKDEKTLMFAYFNRSLVNVELGNCEQAFRDMKYVKSNGANFDDGEGKMSRLEIKINECFQKPFELSE